MRSRTAGFRFTVPALVRRIDPALIARRGFPPLNGLTDGRFLDDPRFAPILARAEALGVPLYLHPGIPPEAVRRAYYDGLPGHLSFMLSIAAWGWHAETAVHVLRLVLSGTLDRYPGLQLIIGHMGESIPFSLTRIDEALSRRRGRFPFREIFCHNFYITTSGNFSTPALLCCVLERGVDRILFSVDYPFSPNAAGRAFLDQLPLSPPDKEKLAHGNADRLLKLRV